jgi:glycosyltransferase involved in cell wall biosynthesis
MPSRRLPKGEAALIRIGVLQPSAQLGGAERSLLTFLKVAQGRSIDAVVLLPREGPLGKKLAELGVPWRVVPMPRSLLSLSRQNSCQTLALMPLISYQGPGYLWRLLREMRGIKPDVIYTNGIKGHILGVLLHPLVPAGVVWHLRDVWGGRLLGFLADYAADLVIANSRATATALEKFMKRPGKVVVIHNAVDPEEFSPEGPVADSGPMRRYRYKVGLVGAYARIKGHALLLAAAARIKSEFPGTGFYFIGGSIYDTVAGRGYEEELRQLVEEKGLKDCVAFTGFQTEMAPWYRAMDMVVNASIIPESFGRTLLEAMSCGTPVVGPNAGGIPEFLRPGENGLLYEMGNAEALAEAILTLLRDPDLRRQLGAGGRRTALRRFSPAPQAEAISRALAQVVREA